MPAERTKPAFELAVGAISRRERTEAELHAWLTARVEDEAEVTEAITRLIEIGQLDDTRFARLYAEDKRELSGWGPDRIREALVEKGVERAIAERAAGVEGAAEQIARAAGLLRARARGIATENDRASAMGYLARRGYDAEVAYAAIRTLRGSACEEG